MDRDELICSAGADVWMYLTGNLPMHDPARTEAFCRSDPRTEPWTT